ncbi:hypothetical protein [Helicobacter pylori]|uniref:hypothetical protein n=1 Tax=Helicobacter pylori TaxID=210 RepID=UPI000EB591F6|nr:hypothetical protein [Helicobacter pylori]
MGSFFSLGKSSNDTQENPKDAQKKEKVLKKVQEENAKLNRDKTDLARERDNLTNQLNASQKRVKALEQSQQVLKNEKAELLKEKDNLTKDKTELTEKNQRLTTEKDKLERENKNLTAEKENLTKERDDLNTALSTAKSQADQTSQKLNELEQKHAPYQKLEKLYEVFLEVKDRLNFNFVATTHSAMDLIASVLSDRKYYLESLYNKASQELSDKRSDKGEKLAELFDLLFEYIKDSKFERLKEPSAYDHTCKKLYPEQNTSQKMQRVVLRGYTYDKKIACYTIVDMGS